MATIGYATLQIIPSLKGVTDAIERQVEGKAVNVTIEPKVDAPKAEAAGKKVRESVEKHTKQVTVEPKVDQRKAEEVGKKTGEAVAKGTTGASTAIGQVMVGVLEGAGGEAGRRLGERLAQTIPTGMTGSAERIGESLRKQLPRVGEVAGAALGGGIAEGIANTIGKERMDKAGRAVLTGLTRAVGAANNATNLGVAIGNQVAGGLSSASGVIGGAATTITNTIGGITEGIDATRQLLGGDDSWAAPGLDTLNTALGQATPLLGAVNGAATLAAAGAQAISVATGIASKAQLLWNAALIANPIGLIVAAIAAVVAGLVLFFTKTELGRKIWAGFTEYLKIAWEGIKTAFSAAWDVISAIWDGMVSGAQAVWDGIRDKFTNVVDFVKGLPSAITNAAKGMWEGLKSGLAAVLNWIGSKWNTMADALSIDLPGDFADINIPKMPKFAGGGYTGNGSTDQAVGVVHGGEYVIKASSTGSIQNAFPGLLDYLNNKGALPMPGYKTGGQVQLGNISGPGITTGEQQSMWDAVRGKFPKAVLSSATRTVMTEGHPDFHNAGRAIDISGPGMGAIASWIASTYPDSLELIHSPFSGNIKNGKNVGDGNSFYGSGLMAAHRDHVHWALGKTATAQADASTEMLSTLGAEPGTSPAAIPAEANASTGSAGTASSASISVPSSISQLPGMGLDGLGVTTQVSQDSPERSFDLGGVASDAISGQASSAMSFFGVGDSPGWLKGLSAFASGVKIGGGDGMAPVSAAPLASAATGALGGVIHGGGGGQQPGPQVNYNIRTATVEDAFLASQRIENERAAANLARY